MAVIARHRARELVLQALYEMDVGGHDPAASLERLIEETHLSRQSAGFARSLLEGVLDQEARIDALIERCAPERPVPQLPAIDRNILRIAIREFIVDNLTPAGAAINEAVELAKKYGSDNSGRFVNGVLGALNASRRIEAQEGD